MNYTNQFNDMVETYGRAQQHIWNDWFDMMQNLQKSSTSTSVWQQPIEVWADFTKRMMETQTQELVDIQTAWIRQGLDEPSPWQQVPTLFADWTRQSQQIAESSAEAGKQMMERWLEAGGHFGGGEMFQTWNGNWQEVITAWKESVDKLLQIQVDALRSVEKSSAEAEKPSSKSKKETGKPAEERAA